MNYSAIVESALRGVVRESLRRVAENGLPGGHHFYISFRTDHPGTEVSDALKAQYPEEMTIVIQHQYWGLEVAVDAFEITLSFNKVSERLHVPYDALTGFFDPSVQFGLQFQGDEGAGRTKPGSAPPPARPEDLAPPSAGTSSAPAAEPQSGEKVVALDRFRKKT